LLEDYDEAMTSDEFMCRARYTKCGFQGKNQMHPVYVDNSALAQNGSARNSDQCKAVEVFWYLCGTLKLDNFVIGQKLLMKGHQL